MSHLCTNRSVRFLGCLNNPSPTGYGNKGQKVWLDHIRPRVKHFQDSYLSTLALGKHVSIHAESGMVHVLKKSISEILELERAMPFIPDEKERMEVRS
jgi:hypothetical protein